MRAIKRRPLDAAGTAFLTGCQKRADGKRQSGSFDANKTCKAARARVGMKGIHKVLTGMVGPRERCMYCMDSHGSDIEHFWPKTPYPDRMFVWENLLLCCTPCGRFKLNKFPMNGPLPLLIDPVSEDPWFYLDFDPATGNLTSRFTLATGAPSEKGSATVQLLQLDGREAVAAGYRKTWINIVRVAERYLSGGLSGSQLATELRHADDHGLLGWCTRGAGCAEPPFDRLWRDAPKVQTKLAAEI